MRPGFAWRRPIPVVGGQGTDPALPQRRGLQGQRRAGSYDAGDDPDGTTCPLAGASTRREVGEYPL